MGMNFPDAVILGSRFKIYVWDGEKWKASSVAPSKLTPLMNSGVGAPGGQAEYTRGDHVHPTDTTRAPVNSPIFSGGVTTDTLTVTGTATFGGGLRTENGRIVVQGHDPQPAVTAHAGARGHARGFFLDTNNYLALGSMDGAGIVSTNVARFDNSGHIWLNGTATLGRDPGAPMEVASKQYVDARAGAGTGAYMPLAGGGMQGMFYPANSPNTLTQAGWGYSIEAYSMGGNDACITFHRPGAFACNFGLGGDANFWYGGWSFGAGVAHRFWTTRDFGSVPVNNSRLAYAGDYTHAVNSGVAEPYGGAVLTGCQGVTYGPMHVRRYRYLQFLTTSWWTAAYA